LKLNTKHQKTTKHKTTKLPAAPAYMKLNYAEQATSAVKGLTL
jgi:hypothetical protein